MAKPENTLSYRTGIFLTITLLILLLIPVTVYSVLNLRTTQPSAAECFDFTGDGKVDDDDFSLFMEHYDTEEDDDEDEDNGDKTYDPRFDFDNDGDIDSRDRDVMESHEGETCPPTASFSTSKSRINKGDSTKLSWTTTRTNSVSIDSIGSVAKSGSKVIKPSSTKTFTLTAKGPGGTVKRSVKITVIVPTTSSGTTTLSSETVTSTPTTGFTTSGPSSVESNFVTSITIKLQPIDELFGEIQIKVSIDGIEFNRDVNLQSTTKEIRVQVPNKLLKQKKTYTLRISADKLLTKKVRFNAKNQSPVIKAGNLFLGDLDSNNNIDTNDLDVLTNEFFEGGTGDLNLDGFVNSLDYSILIKNLGKKGN